MSLVILPDQYQTISLSGTTVNLEYCMIEGAIAFLKEQYAVGTITAKIIQPALLEVRRALIFVPYI
ncbi:MAG: hypothetical protein AB4372_20220 [Xenococcus sp. (in: cyanobacteria)]